MSWRAHRVEMQGLDFVLYGDSITEVWRGTDMNRPQDRAKGGEKSFKKHWGEWRTAALAISGKNTYSY